MKPVTIHWVDIYNLNGWHLAADLEAPESMEATGYLVRDEPNWVAIATTYCPGDPGEDSQGVTVFPRGCILRIEEAE